MQLVESIESVRAQVAAARAHSAGRSIALVPTMGALHEGHLALIRQAGADGSFVVVSVFVNPAQFNDPADLAAYPRTTERDARAAADAGADLVFAPSAAQMYPEGFNTSISVGGVSERWEGASRGASHFDGVALVVTKLLTIVAPDTAWFGAKDAQQLAVIRRVSADLNLPVQIRAADTVRDDAGLALSSRNARLRDQDRGAALSLGASLRAASDAVRAGERDAAALTKAALATLAAAGARPEYWAVVDPSSFEPLARVEPGAPALAIVAAYAGDVRLIDNTPLA